MKQPSAYWKDVIVAKICPYCKSGTRVTDEKEIYGRTYRGRNVICCVNYPTCDSYVGCHDDGEPLGRLAQWPLRMEKKKAHEKFDLLWQRKLVDRTAAYEELADYFNIPDQYCHIGFFGQKACRETAKWATEKYLELNGGSR